MTDRPDVSVACFGMGDEIEGVDLIWKNGLAISMSVKEARAVASGIYSVLDCKMPDTPKEGKRE